jgi:anti-anti-sigma factor
MASEDFTIKETDGVHVVRFTTDNLLSIAEVNRIGGELNKLVDDGARKLVLDLKSVVYAGSATLGMLLSLREKMRDAGGKLVLSGLDNLDKLFSLSRTKALFEIVAAPSNAVALFAK